MEQIKKKLAALKEEKEKALEAVELEKERRKDAEARCETVSFLKEF